MVAHPQRAWITSGRGGTPSGAAPDASPGRLAGDSSGFQPATFLDPCDQVGPPGPAEHEHGTLRICRIPYVDQIGPGRHFDTSSPVAPAATTPLQAVPGNRLQHALQTRATIHPYGRFSW